jgi:hypothetical protein
MTTRHVFLTRDHSPPNPFPTSPVLSLAPALVVHTRMKLRPCSCPNMLPTRT